MTASPDPPSATSETQNSTDNSKSSESSTSEPVWTFRGYRLRASEFTTAMVHFFRAEVSRANVWRMRLDTTTNWAVVTTGAAISFAFTQAHTTHYVIILNVLLVTMFLVIEARRYRYYELWSYRVRLMETDFFAAMLVPPFHPSPDWAEALSENLLHPNFHISFLEAVGRRLRRNFLYIYAVIGVAWLTKLWLQPLPAQSLSELLKRGAVGSIGGEWLFLGFILFASLLIFISLATVGLQEASGEVLPRFGGLMESIISPSSSTGSDKAKARPWFRHTHRRAQLLTFIITDRYNLVAESVLKTMGRGMTALAGTGMFTGQSHPVLMCALTVTEVQQLKALVAEVDPNAFVIVAPAQEVLGKGFVPLQEER